MTLLPYDPDQTPAGRIWPTGGMGDLFRFSGPVGPETANRRDDVIRAQILLGHTGDLDLDSLGGPTGWPGGELTRGLRRYQRRKGLTVDGLMLPDGETMAALREDLFGRLAGYNAPTAAEVDDHHDRLARHPGEGEDMPQTALVMPGEDAPPYVQRRNIPQPEAVMSDADFHQPPAFIPGAQVAQAVLRLNPATTAPATGVADGASQQLPSGVTPEIAKAGGQLQRWAEDKINLLTLPAQVQRHIADGTPIKLPSSLLDPAIEAASRTPPLEPSAPGDDVYSGALLAAGTRALESGIQEIFGRPVERHETANTKLSSNIIVEECNKLIEKNFRLHGFDHFAGASKNGEELREKAVKDKKLGGGRGHSFPDVLYKRGPEEPNPELVGINSATESPPGRYIRRENKSFAQLVNNIGEWAAAMTGKKRKDEDLEDYRKRARAVCEEAFGKFLKNKDAKSKTKTDDPDPETP